MIKDNVNRPEHYTSHPSGVECIQVTEHMGFNLGNVIKYVWRADLKGASIEDLEKALWYLKREIQKRKEVDPIVHSTRNNCTRNNCTRNNCTRNFT